jgi:hypothetical protein
MKIASQPEFDDLLERLEIVLPIVKRQLSVPAPR